MQKILILLLLSICFAKEVLAENNYFLMLKNNKVNVRYGPDLNSPIKYIYKKKFLTIEKFFLYFHNLFKKKHTGISFIDSHSEIIEIKEQLIDYTKTRITTENVAKNIISDTLKYYIR